MSARHDPAPSVRVLELGAGRPSIEVLVAGSGPALVFLHGAGGIAAWEGVLPLLARDHQVFAPLLPGYGNSTGLEALEDQWDLFLHCFDVIEALGIDRPILVGESMGGWIAAEMAALRPREIGKLVLAAPIGLWRDEAPVADMFGMTTQELVPFLFHDTHGPAAQRLMALSGLMSTADDRTDEQVEMMIRMVRGFRTAAKFLFPVPESGLEHRLWRIQAPVLVLWGEQDRFAAPLYADLFGEKIRGARVVKIPDAGHLLALERPQAFVNAVLAWARGA